MKRFLFSVIICMGISLSLQGCISGERDGEARPVGALYQCTGEPGYDTTGMDSMLTEFRLHPEPCKDWTPDTNQYLGDPLPEISSEPVDSAQIQVYIMNKQCDFINTYHTTIAAKNAKYAFVFNFEDAEGNALPTGEYFVNGEVQYQNGKRDTTYRKVAMINTQCSP